MQETQSFYILLSKKLKLNLSSTTTKKNGEEIAKFGFMPFSGVTLPSRQQGDVKRHILHLEPK